MHGIRLGRTLISAGITSIMVKDREWFLFAV